MPPKYVLAVLARLQAQGFKAHMVGGCVRDMLLGRRPNDYDVATDAHPEDVQRVFRHTAPTGIRHGTVTVIIRGSCVEVTTYRVDGAYLDFRRPDAVKFTPVLEQDLARRDFTINAMAMDICGHITDAFGGRADLDAGIIRCVGDPSRRFTEDALRMLRAVRFSAKLGFEIEGATLEAIRTHAQYCAALSAERVAAELRALLRTPRPDLVWELVELGLLDAYLVSRGTAAERPALRSLPQYARLAHFVAALERGGCIDSAADFLRGLKFDRNTLHTVPAAVEILRGRSHDWKRLLRDYGRDAVLCAYPRSRALRETLRSGECYEYSTLAVDGSDAAALGLSGRDIGRALDLALEHVIDHPGQNDKQVLLRLIKEEML